MKRRLIILITVVMLAVAWGSVVVHGQETEGEQTGLSEIERASAGARLEAVSSTFDEFRKPIVEELEAAGDDQEALGQAYDRLAFWALSYAQAVESANFPEGLQPLVDDLNEAYGSFSLAAELLAADPREASLLAAYTDAEQASQASVDALFEAVGIRAPGQDAESVDQQALESPAPSPSA